MVKTHVIRDYINQIGTIENSELDLVQAALSIAALESPDLSIEKYYHHVEQLVEETGSRYKELIESGGAEDAPTQLAALKHVISDKYEYCGDTENYDDLQNANLIRVIERRKGLPIALSILYVHVGQTLGFDICALSFPAHVVCRIDHQGERILFDPFDQCKIMQAQDLRQLLKTLVGQNAELSAQYYEPSSKRDMLMRLQNNIKLRQIEQEDYQGALQTVGALRKIDPKEYRLLLDSGVLNARTGRLNEAIDQLEAYIEKAPNGKHKEEAVLFLREIQYNLT